MTSLLDKKIPLHDPALEEAGKTDWWAIAVNAIENPPTPKQSMANTIAADALTNGRFSRLILGREPITSNVAPCEECGFGDELEYKTAPGYLPAYLCLFCAKSWPKHYGV